ncbi:WD repeat-containing protein 7-like, partial [Carica papaya]|uniref:WD repeat-containing protein 7-like n=1 Tax=Carica papaya TaxID=3649 RepID=UPI000B8CA944
MKCRHVACIWSGAPPSHRVTATAALAKPATLYTGGYDGSIIWWNLSSSSDTNLEVTPIAMLCGHAAPIADLGICYPIANSGVGKTMGHPIIVAISSTLENCV